MVRASTMLALPLALLPTLGLSSPVGASSIVASIPVAGSVPSTFDPASFGLSANASICEYLANPEMRKLLLGITDPAT